MSFNDISCDVSYDIDWLTILVPMRTNVIRSPSSQKLKTGSKPQQFYAPALHVDEIGLTSDKYIPLNESVTSLPLKITISSMSQQVLICICIAIMYCNRSINKSIHSKYMYILFVFYFVSLFSILMLYPMTHNSLIVLCLRSY